jgi:hypothetical protein
VPSRYGACVAWRTWTVLLHAAEYSQTCTHAHMQPWHLVEHRRLPRLRRAPAAALAAAAQASVVAQEHGAAGPRCVVGELAGGQRRAARADGLHDISSQLTWRWPQGRSSHACTALPQEMSTASFADAHRGAGCSGVLSPAAVAQTHARAHARLSWCHDSEIGSELAGKQLSRCSSR